VTASPAAKTPGPTLVAQELVQRYRDRNALDGFSVELSPGVTALIGVNGAGKSTLMTALSGARRPSSGRVAVDGLDPYRFRDRRAALRRVAVMPQLVRFPGGLTVLEVVEYLTWMRGISGSEARAKARLALDRVRLSDRAGAAVKQLSGGMLRRVALAQAIAAEPAVLLLDEPSTGLDPEQRRTMVDLIAQLGVELDTTVLLSSHVMEDVSEVAGRVLVLDAGRLRFDGTVAALQDHAPAGTPTTKAAEAGFLAVLTAGRRVVA
jgi:ABC-2 type transport system ATP-binding protein